MKFNKLFNPVYNEVVLKYEPSITVPDLSFNLREIMDNFGRGLLDINVLKAQCRDELHLATGVYDLSDYSQAMKTTISNYEKALADKERITKALYAMQNIKPSNVPKDAPVE